MGEGLGAQQADCATTKRAKRSKMCAMMALKSWLREQELTVREFALQLEVPLKTAQDWVYRGVAPSPPNQRKLDEFMPCKHHWEIDRTNGPVSRGVCKLCQEVREFENSINGNNWMPAKPRTSDERPAELS